MLFYLILPSSFASISFLHHLSSSKNLLAASKIPTRIPGNVNVKNNPKYCIFVLLLVFGISFPLGCTYYNTNARNCKHFFKMFRNIFYGLLLTAHVLKVIKFSYDTFVHSRMKHFNSFCQLIHDAPNSITAFAINRRQEFAFAG